MGRQISVPGSAEEPTFQLVIQHGKTEYLYRFFGDLGHKRVDILKAPYEDVAYLFVPPGLCTCPARVECKHTRTVMQCRDAWPVLVVLYARAGGSPISVDVQALSHAIADSSATTIPQLGGGPE